MNIRLNHDQARAMGIELPEAHRQNAERLDALLTEARAELEQITDTTPVAEARKIEARYDELIAEFDRLDGISRRAEGLAVRDALLNEPDPRRPKGEDRSINPGDLADGEAYALRADQRMADLVARDGTPEISTGQLLRALAIGPKTDAEKRALSEGSPAAGGYTVPAITAARLIDAARAASVVMQAGATTIPLQSDSTTIAKVLTDPVPAWRSELGPVGTGDPTFGPVTFTARSLAVLVRVSEELLQDSLNISTELPRLLSTALAQEMDRVALYGSGSAPEPKGVEQFTSIVTVPGGALTSYDMLVDAHTEIRANNHVGRVSHILHPRDWGTLAKLTGSGDGQPLGVPTLIAGDQWLTTSKATNGFADSPVGNSTVLSGVFGNLMIGVRQEVRIEILRERYRDTLEIGFLAHLRMDVAATHENAFTKIAVTH